VRWMWIVTSPVARVGGVAGGRRSRPNVSPIGTLVHRGGDLRRWLADAACLIVSIVSTRDDVAELKRLHRFDRWLYRGGRPNRLARLMNRISAIHFATGVLAPSNWVTLEVRGRRSGRTISFPLVVADYEGERYLVAMLGQDTNWVRNVRAAGGRAVLRHGSREPVCLDEVAPGLRAPILRRYLAVAPGARAHVPVDRHAPLEEFDRIAARIPVFRVTAGRSGPRDIGG
jgi:hypothetical protein